MSTKSRSRGPGRPCKPLALHGTTYAVYLDYRSRHTLESLITKTGKRRSEVVCAALDHFNRTFGRTVAIEALSGNTPPWIDGETNLPQECNARGGA